MQSIYVDRKYRTEFRTWRQVLVDLVAGVPGGLVGDPLTYYCCKVNFVGSNLTECILAGTFSCLKIDREKRDSVS